MNKLKNEFAEYLNENITRNTSKWAHALAIADLVKENIELKKTIGGLKKGYFDLNDYSDGLKSKLANQKYLDRHEVEKIFEEYIDYDFKETGDGDDISLKELHIFNDDINNVITIICNLALPEIDKDKIVEETDAEYDITNRRFI